MKDEKFTIRYLMVNIKKLPNLKRVVFDYYVRKGDCHGSPFCCLYHFLFVYLKCERNYFIKNS